MTTEIKINSEPVTKTEDILNVLRCYLATCPLQTYNQIAFRDGHLYCQPRGSSKPSTVMFAGDDIEDFAVQIAQ